MSDAYERIRLGKDSSGRPIILNNRTHAMFQEVVDRLGTGLTIIQGSYLAGLAAEQSSHTHDRGGVIDVRTWSLTDAERDKALDIARQVGFVAWYRTPPVFDAHMHWVAKGDRELHDEARQQVKDAAKGFNGLPGGVKDNLNLDVPTFDYDAYVGEHSMKPTDVAGKDRDQDPFDFAQAAVRGVFAYDAVREGGSTDRRLDVLEGRVSATTDARAQFAYRALTTGGSVDERLKRMAEQLANQAEENRRLKETVARLTAKIDALHA